MMAGPTAEERAFWEENGYLRFDMAISGEDLVRLKNGFDRAASACKEDWLEGIAPGTKPAAHFDIPI